jgi:LmbE family N-acetylglucosaminyl deacetylase
VILYLASMNLYPIFRNTFAFVLLFLSTFSNAQPGDILLKMHQFETVGNVLYIAAHPDDENTRLISYLANSRYFRTAYMSMTRGDGGQNLIGNEQSEELGLIRTQELLAARRTDGGQQFFSRANDFGYSKNPEETFDIWGKEPILEDVVWVIRNFRPDVIITRFPTTGEGGHGHHTASAIIAVEAFEAAADPKRFPEQLKFVQPWKAKRLLWNNFMRWRDPNADMSGTLPLEIGEYLPLLGKSVGEIAAESRSCHRSQGFGSAPQYAGISEYFSHLAGDSAKLDIMDGVLTKWSRIPGGKSIELGIQNVISGFSVQDPSASIPSLMKVYSDLSKFADFPEKDYKLDQLKRIVLLCSGIHLEFNAKKAECFPGTILEADVSVILRDKKNAFELRSIATQGIVSQVFDTAFVLAPGLEFRKTVKLEIPQNAEYTNPYWLAKKHSEGLFNVTNRVDILIPESKPIINALVKLSYDGLVLDFNVPISYKWVDPSRGQLSKPVVVVPTESAIIHQEVLVLSGNDTREIQIELSGKIDKGSIYKLDLPTEIFTSEPREIIIDDELVNRTLTFKVGISPNRMFKPDLAYNIKLLKLSSGKSSYVQTITSIDYVHIPEQTWIKDASVKLVHVNMVRVGEKIGYISGAGDKVAECLGNAGYNVKMLDDNEIKADKLSSYNAIIVGIRAFNTRTDLLTIVPELMKYVENGGNLIVQYNTKNWISDVQVEPGPFPLTVSRDRVTEEKAPVKILDKKHALISGPNAITEKDFDNWIQERGLYFPDKWDKAYTPILSSNDKGEKPSKGMLLAAEFGKGKYVYTGLSFFRELPAGVPGAYRLFANLIAWGNEAN